MSRREIRTDNVTGVGIIFGDRSRVEHIENVTVAAPVHSAGLETARALDELMKLLAEHESEVPDAGAIRRAAAAMEIETNAEKPNKHKLLSLLEGITRSVSGIAVLAEAAARIYAAIAHLPA